MAEDIKTVIDASVVLNWLLNEEADLRAQKLREEYQSGNTKITAPDLIHYEIVNALCSGILQKRLSKDRVIQAFADYQDINIEIIQFTIILQQAALAIAIEHKCSVYDAAYAALAHQKGYNLVTLDNNLQKIFAKL